MAITNRLVTGRLIFHSDRGVQYACTEFRNQLMGLPILQSMSRKGNCWNNAVVESFFKTMKTGQLSYLRIYKEMVQQEKKTFDTWFFNAAGIRESFDK